MPYAWPFGVDRAGRQVWQSLDKTGHILLAGQTGSGKSTLLSLALVSLFDQHGPDELQALLIDPKAVELAPFAGLPHLAQAVAVTPAAASSAVGWLVQEVDRRQALFAGAGCKNLAGYNARAGQPLPRLLVVIDEVVSLVLGGWGGVRAEPYRALVDAAVRARAFGVTLVFAGQSARADVLDLVREQCGVKLALRLDTPYASKAALGVTGAETLPAKTPGRMLAAGLTPEGIETLQGFYLPEAELEARLATLRGRLPSPLSEQERVFVTYAARDLGGAFKVQVLYEAFKGSDWHMSWPALRKLAERWELRGWLTPQANSATARQITPELARVAGLDLAGGQAL
jgi:S-DNA-T family DNA segregation ATPase FtsK/SpoIIIE